MKKLLLALSILTLSSCANSASHEVVPVNKASDDYLSCKEIRREKMKAESVIDGVNQDKQDMTGADMIDGVLWFPFNVIAKQSNYSAAVKAAEKRIDYLTMLEADKGCKK